MAKESRAFGSQRAYKKHLVLGKGGIAGEIVDLRADVEEGFQNFEGRSDFPELDAVSGNGPAAVGGDMVLVGRELLQGQTFDKVNVVEGSADLLLEMLKPGNSGCTVEVEVGAGALGIVLVPRKLTITLAAAGSTVAAVATAINADGADTDGFIRANEDVAGNLTAAVAEQNFTGGVGDYDGNVVRAAGSECPPANQAGATSSAKWTATQLTVTVPALAPLVATDKAQITLSSDGTRADAMSVAVE